MSTMDAETTPAERRRERQRLFLVDVALDLFEEKGFDATTVDEIADAGDISPRTFFRYFESKTEVIMGVIGEGVAGIRTQLVGRPADEPPAVAVREAAVQLLSDLARSDRFLRSLVMLTHNASLRAVMVTGAPMVDAIADGLREREPSRPEEEVAIIAAIAAGLLRRSIESLLVTRDLEELPRATRRAFELSHRVWSEP